MKNRRWGPREARVRRWWHAHKNDPRTTEVIEWLALVALVPMIYITAVILLSL